MKLLLIILLLSPFLAGAKEKPYNLKLKAGYTQTTGNTSTRTLSLGLNFSFKKDRYENLLSGNVLYGESRGKKNIERINLKNRTQVNKQSYFYFWDIRFHRDPFRLYEQRYATGPGIGKKWIDSDKLSFSTTFYIYYYYENLSKHEPSRRKYLMYNLEQEASYRVFDNLTLSENVSLSVSDRESGDYFVNANFKATNRLSKRISLEITYRISYQNKPIEASVKKTDTFLITSLVVSF